MDIIDTARLRPAVRHRARRGTSVCAQPGCPELATNSSYCADHRRDDNTRRAAKSADHGVTGKHFQRLRRQRLALAGKQCELHVDDQCTETATTVHLDPRLDGDHDAATLEDLRAACAHCHGIVDAPRSHDTRRLNAAG